MKSKILMDLLRQTWKSPVFTDSFRAYSPHETAAVMHDISVLYDRFTSDLGQVIAAGMPELSGDAVQRLVGQIAPKSVGFCPALTVGEVDDLDRLQAVAAAIGLMYWGDQTMDRGDAAMPLAIERWAGRRVAIPAALRATVEARRQAIAGIEDRVRQFARDEDVSWVLACYRDQVLLNEVLVQRLSQGYAKSEDQKGFLDQHGAKVAFLATVMAGLPSVSSSLYAIYRQHNPQLPTLAAVYDQPELVTMLQISNAVVRIADELGDWYADSGADPDWGLFTLNPFNQPHPVFIDAYAELADLPQTQRADVRQAFLDFHNHPESREVQGEYILSVFFNRIRDYMTELSPDVQKRYGQYITLTKRVLEIGYVNKMGDIALSEQHGELVES